MLLNFFFFNSLLNKFFNQFSSRKCYEKITKFVNVIKKLCNEKLDTLFNEISNFILNTSFTSI